MLSYLRKISNFGDDTKNVKMVTDICMYVFMMCYESKNDGNKLFFCCGAATQRGSWPPQSSGF
jgi:hypothetical protein